MFHEVIFFRMAWKIVGLPNMNPLNKEFTHLCLPDNLDNHDYYYRGAVSQYI